MEQGLLMVGPATVSTPCKKRCPEGKRPPRPGALAAVEGMPPRNASAAPETPARRDVQAVSKDFVSLCSSASGSDTRIYDGGGRLCRGVLSAGLPPSRRAAPSSWPSGGRSAPP